MIAPDTKPITGNDPASLRELGRKCRSLARGASNQAVATSLDEIADSYDELAVRAETQLR